MIIYLLVFDVSYVCLVLCKNDILHDDMIEDAEWRCSCRRAVLFRMSARQLKRLIFAINMNELFADKVSSAISFAANSYKT